MTLRNIAIRLMVILFILASTTGTAAARASSPSLSTNEKLTSRLQLLAQPISLMAAGSADQALALSLPESGPGSLMHSASGQLLVYIRVSNVSSITLDALRSAGAEIVHVAQAYQTVTADVSPSNLQAVAALPAVRSIEEEFTPFAGTSTETQAQSTVKGPANICLQGSSVSEGDVQLKAALARSTYDLDGTGVTVGILSDSFDQSTSAAIHAAGDIATGDLPGPGNPCGQLTPVNVITNASSTTNVVDEGRAMLQIVHDLAPNASLSFASAWNGIFAYADNIRALRNTAHADIIADDLFYFSEPFFQEGPINVAISDVVNSGASYFTLAGNHNIISNGKNVSSYEAPTYRPTTSCPPVVHNLGIVDCHDFDTTVGVNAKSRITLASGGKVDIDFQWAEPWNGVTTNFNLYLLDKLGNLINTQNYDDNTIFQTPFKRLYFLNSGPTSDFYIVIGRTKGSAIPRLKYIFLQDTTPSIFVENDTSTGGDIVGPTLYGHSSTTSGISVAAVPYNDSTTPEFYTSRGPATFYFGPVVSTTPATALAVPHVINQPDIAATDGGCTTFFGSGIPNCHRFYGTSAATPHAAAVAALLQQRPKQVGAPLNQAAIKTLLQSTVQTVSGGSPDSVGTGLVDALAAAAKINNFSISGHVTLNGIGLAGITVSDGNGHSAITDANGAYTLPKTVVGNYTITPSATGYGFIPFNRTITIHADTPNVDFAAILFTDFLHLPIVSKN